MLMLRQVPKQNRLSKPVVELRLFLFAMAWFTLDFLADFVSSLALDLWNCSLVLWNCPPPNPRGMQCLLLSSIPHRKGQWERWEMAIGPCVMGWNLHPEVGFRQQALPISFSFPLSFFLTPSYSFHYFFHVFIFYHFLTFLATSVLVSI